MTDRKPMVMTVNLFFHRVRRVWCANARDSTGTEVEFYVEQNKNDAIARCKELCAKYPKASFARQ